MSKKTDGTAEARDESAAPVIGRRPEDEGSQGSPRSETGATEGGEEKTESPSPQPSPPGGEGARGEGGQGSPRSETGATEVPAWTGEELAGVKAVARDFVAGLVEDGLAAGPHVDLLVEGAAKYLSMRIRGVADPALLAELEANLVARKRTIVKMPAYRASRRAAEAVGRIDTVIIGLLSGLRGAGAEALRRALERGLS